MTHHIYSTGTLIVKIEHFCPEIVKFYQFFREVFKKNHLGSGAARIRVQNDFSGSCSKFQIRPDPDP
jgi:hypothetical protein